MILFRYISELPLYCSRLTATLKIVSEVATHINESMKKMVCTCLQLVCYTAVFRVVTQRSSPLFVGRSFA